MHTYTGQSQCLCASVTITVFNGSTKMEACHCNMCRKWGGGPFLGFTCHKVELSGEDCVTTFDSSAWAQRTFCNRCGTHLFYQLKNNDFYVVPAGLFQQKSDFHFHEQIFIDQKPSYYDFANNTETLTGEQVFAKFAANES